METLKDYNRAIERFCKDNSDSTIYLVGEISHPGISDLDFLIVDDEPNISDEVKPFLMGGNVLIVPRFALEEIQIIENFNLKLINGTGPNFFGKKVYNQNEKIVEILEWLPERILKCKSLLRAGIDKRDALLLHKSINRSIDAVSKMTGKKYIQITTEEARSNNQYDSSLILRKSIDAGILAWNDFENFLHLEKVKGLSSGKVNISDHYNFENTFHSLLLYFYRTCTIDCHLSKKLLERVSINVNSLEIDSDLDATISRRWDLIDKTYMWFVEKNLKAGMIKYGWLL
jgi:hypothetical protein